MKTATIGVQEWLECFQELALAFASGSLRFDSGAAPDRAPAGGPRPAAYIAVLGESNSIHLGLSTTMQGCHTLARALMGMRQKDSLPEADVVDGMSEILNILAGKVKSRMITRDPSLKLGLPIFIVGEIQMTGNLERGAADVSLGPVPCRLLVFRDLRGA